MDQPMESTATRWDQVAEHYEKVMENFNYFAPKWIAKHSRDLAGRIECRVLDLGCGTGTNVKILCEQHADIRAQGIDFSERMLDRARATGRYANLYSQDLNHSLQESPSETFDLVIAFGFFEFLSDVRACLAECRRVLKSGGLLWATFLRHDPGDPFSPPRTITLRMKRSGQTESEIREMMHELGMSIISLDPISGYVTENRFVCPYYVLRACKASGEIDR
jgi:Predicted methyltransferase (contains TPR repeat)